MEKLTNFKNKLVNDIAQSLANSIVDALQMSTEMGMPSRQKEMIIFYGLLLDNYMIKNHGVYLE
jgi:hypothetical protein